MREASAHQTSGRIRVDGVLDEPVWHEAPLIGALIQQVPSPGAPPSEATEVRIVYNRDSLYIGVRCHDRSPGQLRTTQMRRDGDFTFDDSVQLLVDTFHSRSNAYFFATNPAGVMVDGTISDNNRTNLNWDGIWRVKGRIDDGGWTAEFEIPFKIHEGIAIPPGDYSFHRHAVTVQTAQNRPFSFLIKAATGGFFSGNSQDLTPAVIWRKNRHLTTSFELQQYWVNLQEGDFRTRLALFRLDYSFSPNLNLANFVQYDTDTRNLGLQSRLRWIVQPGNELFFVINHAWQYQTLDRFEQMQAILTNARVKLNYTFRF